MKALNSNIFFLLFTLIAITTSAQEDQVSGKTGSSSFVRPSDTHFNKQWWLSAENAPNSNNTANINIDQAWMITQGSQEVTVAVLDGGIKMDHPEFANRLWTNSKEIPNNNIDDDHNGFIDDQNGWDFVSSDNDPTDEQGHGTNVAGIIASNGNNGTGYTGIDWNCKIMPIRITDEHGSGKYVNWAAAIRYAVDNGADVINMSVGGTQYSSILASAVKYAAQKNVVIVTCMMNDNSETTYYPAAYESTIAVGATNVNNVRATPFSWSANSGSNYGNHIDLVAPGNYIYGLDFKSSNNYNSYWSGTSQAAPMVAGVVALMKSIDKTLTPSEIKEILQNTSRDQVGSEEEDLMGWDKFYGHGLLDAGRALKVVAQRVHKTGDFGFEVESPMLTSSIMGGSF